MPDGTKETVKIKRGHKDYGKDILAISKPSDPLFLDALWSLPNKTYLKDEEVFIIPYYEMVPFVKAVGKENVQIARDIWENPMWRRKDTGTVPADKKIHLSVSSDETFRCQEIGIRFSYNKDYVSEIKSMPSRRYFPDTRTWVIPITDLSRLVLNVGYPYFAADENVKQTVFWKEIVKTNTTPVVNGQYIQYQFKTQPYPHQIEAFNLGMHNHEFLICDEQGLGKTIQAINIICAKKQQGELNKCLIVCGVNSTKYNWENEIEMHSYAKSVMFDGATHEKKMRQINEWKTGDALYGIINIEALRNEEILDALKEIADAVIVDEIHKAKNPKSQQGKAIKALDTPVKIGLTGTPITSKAEDLWNILSWIKVEQRNFWQFQNYYCEKGGYKNKEIIGYRNIPELNRELSTCMIRRKKDEVLDLPPKIYKTEYVEMNAHMKQRYKEAQDGILKEFDKILNTSNPLSCTLRLRQVTGGLFTEPNENEKLKRCKELLEEEIIPNGHKAIIFSQWESVTELYRDAFAAYHPAYIVGEVKAEDRQKEVQRFQNDEECKLAIGTIGAMGTGLTMTAASYVIFADKGWTAADNAQAEDRAHRIGTASTVSVITLVAKNSIDEHIERHLQKNKEMFDQVVEGKKNKEDIRKMLMDIATQ